MRVAIVNYGMGNLGSVLRAFGDIGAQAFIAEYPTTLFGADRIVLPGVGSFAEGMARLEHDGWSEVLQRLINDRGVPILGICLGMQMLAMSGDEGGPCKGLGLIDGAVRRLDAFGCASRIPHVGWNDVSYKAAEPLFHLVPQNTDFYFVHSYALETPPANVSAVAAYDVPVTAAVRKGPVFGTQFHPEKSSKAGRQVLRNFLDVRLC